MPSRGSKRNLLAGMDPLTPPASDDEVDTNNDQQQTKLSSIRENGSPEHTAAASADASFGDDEKKDDTTHPNENANAVDANNTNETRMTVHEPPEHRTAMPRRSSLKQSSVPPLTNVSSPSRKNKQNTSLGGNARRRSSSVASEAESECSITLDAIGPALTAFGGAPAQAQINSTNTKDRFDNSRGASGATASTSNRPNNNNNSGGGPPPSSLRARPGLLVKQKTTRNVQKTTSFVQTAGMRRAKERHFAQQKQQKNSNMNSDPATDGRPRSGSGGSLRMMHGRRVSGVSHASSLGESMNLSGLANPDDYMEIDLCDECLHCPSLTALRQSFHESLMQGDNACSKAEDESGR